MATIPTVTICNPHKPGSYLIINAAEFVPGKHIAWAEASDKFTPPPALPVPPVSREPIPEVFVPVIPAVPVSSGIQGNSGKKDRYDRSYSNGNRK